MLKTVLLLSLFLAVLGELDNKTRKELNLLPISNITESLSRVELNGARCYDNRLSNFINTALQYYSHNMGQLAQYILDQINRAGMGNYWLVHAEMIGSRHQGLDWQTLTNGDLFQASSRHGCYFHDTQTYIFVVKY